MNRRQFFKRVAGVVVGLVAAPTANGTFLARRAKKESDWVNYTAAYDPSLERDRLFLEQVRVCFRNIKFIPPTVYSCWV